MSFGAPGKKNRLAKLTAIIAFGVFGLLSLLFSANVPQAQAATSSYFNFQMRLLTSSGAVVSDGNYHIEFKLYNAANSTGSSQGSCSGDSNCLWTETRTTGNLVRVVNGYFSVQLGSVTALPSINWNQELWLGVRIGGSGGSPSWETNELTSDGTATGNKIALTAVPYAFTAKELQMTSGSFTNTLLFATPSGSNKTITIPNETGTICTTGSVCTGYQAAGTVTLQGAYDAGAAGDQVIALDPTQDSIIIRNPSSSGSDSTYILTLDQLSTGASGGLSIQSAGTGNLLLVTDTTATARDVLTIADGGATTFRNQTDSTTAFQIQNSAGTPLLNLDTSSNLNILSNGSAELSFSGNWIAKGSATVTQQNNSIAPVFGSNSIKIDTTAAVGDGVKQNITLGDTTAYALSFYLKRGSGASLASQLAAGYFDGTTENDCGLSSSTDPSTTSYYRYYCTFTTPASHSGTPYIYIKQLDASARTMYVDAVQLQSGSTVSAYQEGLLRLDGLVVNSPVVFKAQSNDNGVFAVQNAAGTSLLSLDTWNSNSTFSIAASATSIASDGIITSQSSAAQIQFRTGGASSGNIELQGGINGTERSIGILSAGTTFVPLFVKGVASQSADLQQWKDSANLVMASIGATGAALFKNSVDSTTAFQIQNAAGTSLLVADTTNSRIYVGNPTGDTVGALLVLDTKTDTGDPTGVEGAMYYNDNANKFRCYQNTGWTDCITAGGADTLQSAYDNGGSPAIISLTSSDDSIVFRNPAALGSDQTYILTLDQLATGANGGLSIQSAGTGNLLLITDTTATARDVLTIADGGATTFRSQTDSTTAFQIQNSSGNTLYNVNTSTTVQLVSNNSIETDINGWVAKGSATLSLDSSVAAQFGSRYLQAATTAAADDGAAYRVPLKASTQYSLSIWARLSTGSASTINFGRQDNGSDNHCLTGQTVNTIWTQFTCTFTTGATVNSTTNLFVKQTDATARNIYIDGLSLVEGATALTFNAGGNQIDLQGNTGNINLNNTNTGELQAWQLNANALPAGRFQQTSVIANGYVYAIGGTVNGAAAQSTVYYAKLNADGSTGTWTTNANALPAVRKWHSSATANGYLYVIGGDDGSDIMSTIYYAKLNADGSTGAWSTNANALLEKRYRHTSVIANGYIYVIGGRINNAARSTVHYAKLNADGSTGAWSTNANPLPDKRFAHSTVVANGYVYVMGGDSADGGGTYQSTVYYAKLNADGSIGAWSTNTNALPVTSEAHTSVAANGYVYVLGGDAGTGRSTVYYAKLNADGSIGAWSTNTNALPATRTGHSSVVANGYVYVIGGSAPSATVYYASTSRILIGGSLDLVGLGGQNLSEGGDFSQGSTGGSLTAGNTKIIGSLEVAGQANFSQNVGIGGALSVSGPVAIQNSSKTGFFIQGNAANNPIVDINTLSYVNLLNEGNFEGGQTVEPIGGWNEYNGAETTFATSTDAGKFVYGTKSLKVITSAAASDQGTKYIFPFKPNTTYTFSAYVSLSASGGTAYAFLANINGSDETCDSGNGGTGLTFTTTPTRYTCTFTTGGTVLNGTDFLFVRRASTDANIRTIYVDGAQLEQTSYYTTYTEPVALNLIGNPSFETSANGWALKGSGTTIAQDEQYYYSGTRSLKATTTTTTNAGASYTVPLSANTLYSLSGYARVASSSISDFVVGRQDNGSNNTCLTAQTVTTTWTRFSCSFTTGTTVNSTTNIFFQKSGATAETFYIDAIQLERSYSPSEYLEAFNNLHVDAATSTVTINGSNSGELGPWSLNANALPGVRVNHSSVVANGYVYAIGGDTVGDGSSPQSTVYYAKLNADGSTGSWSTNANALPATRYYHSSVVANGYVYVMGGFSGTAQSTVYYAKLNADGSIGKWSTANSLPGARYAHTSVVANGYVYVIGGDTGGAYVSTVYYAKLNADGSIGSWSTNANNFPATRESHTSVVANGYVYVFGGYNGSTWSTVYYAKLNADGSTGSWSTANALPKISQRHSTVIANGYVYVIGGNTGSIQSTVYYASTSRILVGGSLDLVGLGGQNLSDGGDFSQGSTGGSLTAGNTQIIGSLQVAGQANFSQNVAVQGNLAVHGQSIALGASNSGEIGAWQLNANSLPAVRHSLSSVVANGYVYAIGGYNGGAYQSTVYYAKLSSDGSTGTWSTNANALPANRAGLSSVVANGYVYAIGGTSGSTQSTVYYAKLNSDGSTGTWSTNANPLPAVREYHTSVVANGYVYVIGGDSAGGGGAPQSTVYYAKLNADGSTGSWSTNANALPAIRYTHSSVVANGYVYVIGGSNGGTQQTTVYYAKLNADGSTGTWSTNTNALPVISAGHTSIVANGYVYVIGKYDGSVYTTTYYAKLNADGSTGSWSTNANALPTGYGIHTSVVANGYVYAIGGCCTQSTIYYGSTSRILIGGSLDLVGLGGQQLAEGGDFSQGSTGGSLTAGNTKIIGSLEVTGQANFGQGVSVLGNFTNTGWATLTNTTNSVTAFQIQNAAGTALFNADTSNSILRPGLSSSTTTTSQTDTEISDADLVGQETSITIGTDGLPIISYYEDDTGGAGCSTNECNLKVTKCTNASCSTNTTTEFEDADQTGRYSSIAIGTDGLPIVSYQEGDTNGGGCGANECNLKVTKCANVSCSSGTTTEFEDADNVGQFTSIAIGSDGLPIISHYNTTGGNLQISKCANLTCTSLSSDTEISDADDVGQYSSIAIGTDGLPIISSYNATGGNLQIGKCANAGCTSLSADTEISDADNVGGYTSIAIGTDGLPIISHYNSTGGNLQISKCANTACTSLSADTEIVDGDIVGQSTSIAIGTDGLPIISHRNASGASLNLQISKCANNACTSLSADTEISDADDVGQMSSIAIGTDGLPIISSRNDTGDNLQVLKCATRDCATSSGTALTSGIDLGTLAAGFRSLYADTINLGKENARISLDDVGNFRVNGLSVKPSSGAGSTVLSLSSGLDSLLEVKQLGTNFGGYTESGAFIDRNSYIAEEFSRARTAVAGDTASVAGGGTFGDNESWQVDEQTNSTNDCQALIAADTVNGIAQLQNDDASTTCNMYYASALADLHLQFDADNLPVVLMKVRPSNVGASDDLWVGLQDQTQLTTNDEPDQGIFFTNADGSTWTGVVKTADANRTAVTCTSQTVNTGSAQYALLKIEVISTSEVRFYVDNDVSNGISWYYCGSATSSANIPTVGLSSMLKWSSTTTTRQLNTDFFRVWQDDSQPQTPEPESQLNSEASSEQQPDSTLPLLSASPVTVDQLGIIDFLAVSAEDTLIDKNLYVRGTLFADKIVANQIEGLEIFTNKISSLEGRLSELGASTSDAQTNQVAEPGYSLQNGNGSISLQGNLSVSGNLDISGYARLSSLVVGGNAEFGGNVTVDGTLNIKRLTIAGHFTTTGEVPRIELLAVNPPLVTIDGNDTSGTIKIVTGSEVVAAGDLVKAIFNGTYDKKPWLFINAANLESANVQLYRDVNTGYFIIKLVSPLDSNKTYEFDYFIVQ